MLMAMFLLITGCAKSAKQQVQEQVDLGNKYLAELDYEQAIVAFSKSIEIDLKNPTLYEERANVYVAWAQASAEDQRVNKYERAAADYNQAIDLGADGGIHTKLVDVYMKWAEIYIELDDYVNAQLVLETGISITEDNSLQEVLTKLQEELQALASEQRISEIKGILEKLVIPFSVDNMVLGVTDLSAAKAAYGGRPYAQSNFMRDGIDTVYTCYGMNGTPIPAGHKEMEFGYFFAAPQAGGAITEMVVNDNDLLCLGSIHNGEPIDWAVELFQMGGYTDLLTDGVEWETKNGKYLAFSGDIQGSGILTYQEESKKVRIWFEGGFIHKCILSLDMK